MGTAARGDCDGGSIQRGPPGAIGTGAGKRVHAEVRQTATSADAWRIMGFSIAEERGRSETA
jgi:hypothetical protein